MCVDVPNAECCDVHNHPRQCVLQVELHQNSGRLSPCVLMYQMLSVAMYTITQDSMCCRSSCIRNQEDSRHVC